MRIHVAQVEDSGHEQRQTQTEDEGQDVDQNASLEDEIPMDLRESGFHVHPSAIVVTLSTAKRLVLKPNGELIHCVQQDK
jgi:hypothetical protein